MKSKEFLSLLLIISLTWGCKKSEDKTLSSVFFRLYQADSSYQPGSAFQMPDNNFILYGFPPEDDKRPPIIIKTDPQGNIIWKKPLTPAFHYCTIKLTASGIIAVGVPKAISTEINVCELDFNGEIVNPKSYQVSLKSGPLMTPKFEDDDAGNLLIAGMTSSNDPLPFIYDTGNGVYKVFDFADGNSYLTKGLYVSDSGIIMTGSSFHNSASDPTPIETFCMRLDNDFNEVWSKVFTNPSGSVTTSCGTINGTADSIVLFGVEAVTATPNNTVADVPGILYSKALDFSGNPGDSILYRNYQRLGHFADIAKTNDKGYVLAATTNELSDTHIVTSYQIYLLKLDSTFHEQWHTEYNTFKPFTACSVCQTNDGGYLISGYELSEVFHNTMCLIKTDAKGNIVAK